MHYDEKKVNDIERILDQAGYTLSDMIFILGQCNSKKLMLDDRNYSEYARIFETIDQCQLSREEKGRKLEELTVILFQNSVVNLFDVYKNCRTSTNEIDLLIRWTENARLAGIDTVFPCFGESFLCECKNYKGKVKVTYIGKFYSLMDVTGTNLGIMVSWEGVSGRGPWSDSIGLIKKIALRDKKYIIVIDKSDLMLIYKKEASIFSIVNDKFLALKNEIDFSKYILKHSAQQALE